MSRWPAAVLGAVLALSGLRAASQERLDPARGAALVERTVAALGGAAAVDGVRALEIKATGTRWASDQAVPVKTLVHILFPGRYRQEVVLPMGTMATVLTPEGAYAMNDKGSVPLSASERHGLEASLGRNIIALLQSRREPTAPPVWTETSEVDKVRLEMVGLGSKESTTLGIDAGTGLIRQITYMSGSLGTFGLVRIVYSDYRPAGPIQYPFRAVGTIDGKPLFTTTVESVTVNGKLADSLFVPRTPIRHPPLASPK